MAIIRRATEGDISALLDLRIANRAYLERWEPDTRPPGRRYTREYYEEWVKSEDQFVVLDGDVIVGTVQLVHGGWDALSSAMVGYWIGEQHAGKGLATRAVHEILEVAFVERGFHRVEAGTAVENVASQRVLERNGFTRVGRLRAHLLIGGEWRDHYLFETLSDDPR